MAAAAFDVFIRARHQVELFEHAQAMLEQLRRDGYVIGALSNGNADVGQTLIGSLFDFQYQRRRGRFGQAAPRHVRESAGTYRVAAGAGGTCG